MFHFFFLNVSAQPWAEFQKTVKKNSSQFEFRRQNFYEVESSFSEEFQSGVFGTKYSRVD